MNQALEDTPSTLKDPYYPRLKSFVINATGMVFYADKDEDLVRIIDKRMKATDAEGCATYLQLISKENKSRNELDELVGELTIGETYFFRHIEQFDALRNVILPHIIKKNSDTRRIRIWSAGCSTGAEPYTISIILEKEFGSQIAGWTIDIMGTDINKKFLAFAATGRFKNWALRATPDHMKRDCFTPADKDWQIDPAFKKRVTFQYHNLVEDPFPSHIDNLFAFDLILCRNVTIYFNREVIRKMIGQFHDCMVDEGWLVVGHSEPDMELFKSFRTVSVPGTVLYQKSDRIDETEPSLEHPAPPVCETAPIPAWTPPPPEPEPAALPEITPETPPSETVEPEKTEAGGLDEIKGLADQGKLEEAARCCEKLMEKDKLNPSVHLFHALVLGQMGQDEEAEKALRGAIYLDRGFVLPHYHFGLFLQKKGDSEGAVRSFSNALKLLSKMDDGQTFEDGDGISVAQLKEMAEIHLEVAKGT